MSSSGAKAGLIVGLCVSGFIVVVVVALVLYFVLGGDSIAPPTRSTTAAGVLDPIELKLDTSALFKIPDAGGGGAERLYAEAFKQAWNSGDTKFIILSKETPEPEKNPVLKPVIDKIVAAADVGLGSDVVLDFDNSDVSIGPKSAWPIRDVIAAMARATCKAGMSARADKKRDLAEKYFRASFIFGQRLWNQGAYVSYKGGGLAAMSEALANLQSSYGKNWYNEPAKETIVKDLYSTYLDVSRKFEEKGRIMRSVKPNTGDLHNLAQNDKDPAWKLEGIMFLGMAKWTSAGKGERAAIQSYLEKKIGSGDPLTAKKAKEAADFSRSDIGLIPAG